MPTGARWKCSSTTYPYRQKMALTERCQSASSYISTFPLFINKGWMKMLRGKRAVITGGGTGFGQALSVWLAREGVEVDFCARRADDIQKTCSIITAEGGMAKGHLCDLTLPESLSVFFTVVNFRQAHRHFNPQCCSVAFRNVRRSIRHRNHKYYQFRPDRFYSADSGIATRVKTFRKCGYRLNYIFMWDS